MEFGRGLGRELLPFIGRVLSELRRGGEYNKRVAFQTASDRRKLIRDLVDDVNDV